MAAWLNCPNRAYKKLTGLKSHQHMLALIFRSPCLGASHSCMQWQAAGEQTGRHLRRDLQPELPPARFAATRWVTGGSPHPWLLHNSGNLRELQIEQAKRLCPEQQSCWGTPCPPIPVLWNFIHLPRFRGEEKGEVSLLFSATQHCFLPWKAAWAPHVYPAQHLWLVSMQHISWK